MSKTSVLVTGASSGGIGAALALAFHQKGLIVFAAVRNPAKAAELEKLSDVHIITLDVTSEPSIAAAAALVNERTSGQGLDILVNNCGVNYTMPLVDSSVEKGRELFDVNFWGTLAMVNAFIPQLSKTKGTVVNISSVGSMVYTPWIGLYAASKSALNTMSETLRLELAPFDIKILTIMAGSVKSKIFENQGVFKLPENSLYTHIEPIIAESASGKANPEGTPTQEFASKVVASVLNGAHGTTYIGNKATTTGIISRYTPPFMLDAMMLIGRGLDELAKHIQNHDPYRRETFRKGSKIMMPFRQLHKNEDVYGSEALTFDGERFLKDKNLRRSTSFCAFGWGATYFPGGFTARHKLVSFIVLVLQRFDISLVAKPDGLNEQRLLRMEGTKPSFGMMGPLEGEDLRVRVKPL